MKIIVYSDIHSSELKLLNYNPDLVFVLGDIEYWDIKKIDEHYACPKLGVLGNHDRLDFFRGTSVVNLHEKVVVEKGVRIAGFGGCPRYNSKDNQYEETDVRRTVNSMEKVDIFLSHANPAFDYSFDRTNPHRGFVALTEMLEQGKATYLFHGHIHENNDYFYGTSNIISTYGIREIEIDLPEKK